MYFKMMQKSLYLYSDYKYRIMHISPEYSEDLYPSEQDDHDDHRQQPFKGKIGHNR